jgi:hypothetical protein
LIWREDIGHNESARAIRTALAGFLISEVPTHEWPGTRMLAGGPALMLRFNFSDVALATLLKARRLYAWEAPARPEDPAFYAGDGRVWFGSVVHEQQAFFGPAAPAGPVIVSNVPGLRLQPPIDASDVAARDT